jgi:LPS export ABC transporter protein LptC
MAITMDAREAPLGRALKGTRNAAERARAFRRARRHSLLVKILRVVLPVGAAGFTAYYALTLGVSWQMGAGRLKVGEVQLTPDDLTMKNATYFGLTKDGGRYEVRAKKAIVEFNKEAPIKLIDIDGDLLQANDVTTKLKAKHGLLDNAKSELELYDGIEIDASNGMKARMSRAMVYSKEHRIVSKHPVDLSMPTGRVQGATMTMRSDTREATFVGDVKAHLVSTEQPGQAAPSTPAFGRDTKHPIDVTADQLYVNDLAKTALFMGKVVAVQGDSTLKAPELHIAYEGRAAAEVMTASAQQPQQPEEGSRLSRRQGRCRHHRRCGQARSQRPGRVRRQGRHRAVRRQRPREPAEKCAARQAAVHRPQGRYEPPRDAGGGHPHSRPHRRNVLPERCQECRAAEAEICRRQ